MDLNELKEGIKRHLNIPVPSYADDLYDLGRYAYCHLVWMKEIKGTKYAVLEVRGADFSDPEKFEISIVNWEILAGTGSLTITKDNVEEFEILEDNKTLQVLLGYEY